MVGHHEGTAEPRLAFTLTTLSTAHRPETRTRRSRPCLRPIKLLERVLTRALNANQAQRIWFKLATEHGGDVSKVTDCAQISLGFATAEGLERAARFVLLQASTFKNRVANPTDEGYRDLTFTVLISGHVCEVRAAPPAI